MVHVEELTDIVVNILGIYVKERFTVLELQLYEVVDDTLEPQYVAVR